MTIREFLESEKPLKTDYVIADKTMSEFTIKLIKYMENYNKANRCSSAFVEVVPEINPITKKFVFDSCFVYNISNGENDYEYVAFHTIDFEAIYNEFENEFEPKKRPEIRPEEIIGAMDYAGEEKEYSLTREETDAIHYYLEELMYYKKSWNELKEFLEKNKNFEMFKEPFVEGYKNCQASVRQIMKRLIKE